MKKFIASTTKRCHVTIPAEVRLLLGLKPRDKVVFIIDEGEVRITPASFSLATAYGSIKLFQKFEDVEEVSQAAKDEKAQKTAQELSTT
jgi:AbrB family looped-hinge helix DNA binding protein